MRAEKDRRLAKLGFGNAGRVLLGREETTVRVGGEENGWSEPGLMEE